jgi:hypothetical protein
MSPAAPTMDTMLPSTGSSLFNVPQLAEDGTNWITYKERILTVIGARGLMCYVDGRAVKPVPYAVDATSGKTMKPDGKEATETEIEELDKKLDEFFYERLTCQAAYIQHDHGSAIAARPEAGQSIEDMGGDLHGTRRQE